MHLGWQQQQQAQHRHRFGVKNSSLEVSDSSTEPAAYQEGGSSGAFWSVQGSSSSSRQDHEMVQGAVWQQKRWVRGALCGSNFAGMQVRTPEPAWCGVELLPALCLARVRHNNHSSCIVSKGVQRSDSCQTSPSDAWQGLPMHTYQAGGSMRGSCSRCIETS
jgi:hypothetical protein